MMGIITKSPRSSTLSLEASLVKIRQGVKTIVFSSATNFWELASNMPVHAQRKPGRATKTTSSTASQTKPARWRKLG